MVLDYDCPGGVELVELIAQEDFFSTKNKWLILEETDSIRTSSALTQLNTSQLYVNAEISYFNSKLGILDENSKWAA